MFTSTRVALVSMLFIRARVSIDRPAATSKPRFDRFLWSIEVRPSSASSVHHQGCPSRRHSRCAVVESNKCFFTMLIENVL